MKEFRWYLILAALVASVTAAEAQFPRPRPSSAPARQVETVQPAPVQQAQQPAPQVVVEAPPQSDFFNYIFAGLFSVFTALFGFNVFKSSGGGGIPKLTPEARAAIDAAAGRFIESGIPGQALQAGAGFVPGLAGIAAIVEPMARRAALELVAQREAANRAAGTAAGALDTLPGIPAAILNENVLTRLADELAGRIKTRLAA